MVSQRLAQLANCLLPIANCGLPVAHGKPASRTACQLPIANCLLKKSGTIFEQVQIAHPSFNSPASSLILTSKPLIICYIEIIAVVMSNK
jgi:hypothetical protein